MFRNNSAGKFTHQELNESTESTVDIEILTQEEQNSLNSNTDLAPIVDILDAEFNLIADPRYDDLSVYQEFNLLNLTHFRSPITEIVRTPIVAGPEDSTKKKEENLIKKLADKLISTAISNSDEDKKSEEKFAVKKTKSQKNNLIFEDDDENVDMFSTPPKKSAGALKDGASSRTPLSCVANTNTPRSSIPRSYISHSTPKNKINPNTENSKSVSRIPVSSSRIH